jgi:hypothetical protein
VKRRKNSSSHPSPRSAHESRSEGLAEAPDWFYENFATLCHAARSIHIVYVGFLVYCALTIRSTSDRQIVLNEGAHLPLLNVDIPFSIFLISAPAAAIFIYLYFQLHVQVMKRQLYEYYLPNSDRVYPWMLVLAEHSEAGAIGFVQRLVVNISLWWLLPTVLLLFAWLTVRIGNIVASCVDLFLFAAGITVVFWLYNRYHNIRTNSEHVDKSNGKRVPWFEAKLVQIILAAMAIIICVLFLITVLATNNKVFQARFDLSGQILKGAHLRNARLQSAKLEFTNFEDANLSTANLRSANLAGATLKNANIRESSLYNANLNCADLSGANLDGSDLTGAFLVSATLTGATINCDQLSRVKTLWGAKLTPGICSDLKKGSPALFDAPKLETQETESYHSNRDAQPIIDWETEKSTLLEKAKLDPNDKRVRVTRQTRDTITERILVSDATLLVRPTYNYTALALVRFYLTVDLLGVHYLQTEELSRVPLPCAVEDNGQVLPDPKLYDNYVGQYQLAAGSVLTVRKNGERLIAEISGQASVEIVPRSDAEFFSDATKTQFVFVSDENRAVTGVVVIQNGLSRHAPRIGR